MGNVIQFNPVTEGKRFNGERLKAARIWRKLSAIQLAEETSLKRQTISMYENGKLENPEFSTIQRFSEVLGFPVKFFLEEIKAEIADSTTYFRSLLTTNKKYRIEQEEKIQFVSVIYYMLTEYLNFEKLNLPNIPESTTPQEAANMLRKHWKLGNKPIENLVYLVESNGIVVMDFDTDTDHVDAFSHKIDIDDAETYLIGYSRNKKAVARIHFDIAHELGHILLHNWNEDLEELSKEEFKEIEREAHAFASAFLLPKESFSEDVSLYAKNLAYYAELKKRWKTSIAAMIRRSRDLDVITKEEYSRLMRYMQKQGIRKEEPLDKELRTMPPSLLRQAINVLLDQKIFKPNEFLGELSGEFGLTLYPADVEDLLGLQKGTLKETSNLELEITIKK